MLWNVNMWMRVVKLALCTNLYNTLYYSWNIKRVASHTAQRQFKKYPETLSKWEKKTKYTHIWRPYGWVSLRVIRIIRIVSHRVSHTISHSTSQHSTEHIHMCILAMSFPFPIMLMRGMCPVWCALANATIIILCALYLYLESGIWLGC